MSVVSAGAKPVPALANTPSSFGIDASDIKRRRVYIGNGLSSAVQNDLAGNGDVFVSSGQDDSEPEVLWVFKDGYDAKKNPGVLFHVIDMYKNWTTSVDGSYQKFDFTDTDRPPGCDKTWNFDVVIPDLDADMPYSLSLKRSGMPAAQKIIDAVIRNMINGPVHNTAFRFWSVAKPVPNGSGKYYAAQVRVVDAAPAHVEIAASVSETFAPRDTQPALTSGNQPAI